MNFKTTLLRLLAVLCIAFWAIARPVPALGQVVFSEIMPDPSPSQGLPEAEYVELYNHSNSPISMEGWKFADERKASDIPPFELPAGGYAILSATKHQEAFQQYGLAIGIPSIPTLNNGGENLYLINSQGDTVSHIDYKKSWYKDRDKEDGGWSLENAALNNPCISGEQAWGASLAPLGGTPGGENSFELSNIPFQITMEQADAGAVLLRGNRPAQWEQAQYWIRGNGQAVLAEVRRTNAEMQPKEVALSFDKLPLGYQYELSIEGLEVCGEESQAYRFPLVLGKPPQFIELLITEIMADPSPSAGLPEVEYLELHNATERWLSLKKLLLKKSSDKEYAFPDTLIPPKAYWAISDRKGIEAIGQGLALDRFPSLNNGGEYLGLWHEGSPIFEVSYEHRWHQTAWGKEGGFSLEMTRIGQPCLGEGNWQTSSAIRGGTPNGSNAQQLPAQDYLPPKLIVAQARESMKIALQFDETLHPRSIQKLQLECSEALFIADTSLHQSEIVLKLNEALLPQVGYDISVIGVEDCAEHTAMEQSYTVYLPEKADSGDILINEVLPKPFAGGTRFIEVINRSNKHINLQGWQVARGNGEGEVDRLGILTEGFQLLSPQQIMAFTADTALLRAHYPQALEGRLLPTAEALPSWGYEEERSEVFLLMPNYRVSDQMRLSEDMVFPLINEDRGVSIERVDQKASSEWSRNWRSASSTAGNATPGAVNSQALGVVEVEEQWKIEPKVFSPNQDGYNDSMNLYYRALPANTSGSIYIYDERGRLWKQLAINHLMGTEGFYQWDGIGEGGLLAPAGIYIAFIEVFQPKGSVQRLKLPFALGGR